MNIGFDAKRAFLNSSGLGNYSRTVITSLVQNFSANHYTLFTTKKNKSTFSEFISGKKNVSIIQPKGIVDTKLNSRWRSYGITKLLGNIDVYHGLSNELPFNIQKFKGKKIVTIHDLIFLRHPKLYPFIDRKMYNKKCMSACKLADVIVAISEQTKNDIQEFYSVDSKKIKVVYQSCDDLFHTEYRTEEINKVKTKYGLPAKYLLNVGTIEERKNLLTIVKAIKNIKDIPLVVVGKKKTYFKKVQEFIAKEKIEKRILFLANVPTEDLPAIYSGAEIFIYPSLFEGFGIPVIEALTRKTPVITTKGGCFTETGGSDSVYIDPMNTEQLAHEITHLLSSPGKRKEMSEKGFEHAKNFLPETIASQMMKLYSE
ncbi:MAG: glycosyltransferase family 4 protein [Bacteroidetes bacterium]|nr:glycosyltransferase family 4 protein [Bacteroidota bacterium]